MAEMPKKRPDYQVVDGFTLLGAFDPEAFRSTVNFKPRLGDTFVATFPKNGTTWTQQILYLIKNGGKPSEKNSEVFFFCPYLEMTGTEIIEDLKGPRTAKIHLPFNLSPYSAEAKYIVVIRNPKDTLVSFYHHTRCYLYDFSDGDFNDFFEIFINGENDYGDYFDHLLSWYEHRNDPNILFLYYEKMKKDHRGMVVEMAKFLGTKYEEMVKDESILNDIVKYSSLEYMKIATNAGASDMVETDPKKSSHMPKGLQYINKYLSEHRKGPKDNFVLVRKGIIGEWRDNFTPDQNKRMDDKIEAKLRGTEMLDYWNSINCLT